METQVETEVSEAAVLQALRRKETINKAQRMADLTVKSFASAMAATGEWLDASSRSALYDRADKFLSEAIDSAAKGVMLLCVFSGGGDESRMYEALLDFLVMRGCQAYLRTASLNKGGLRK